MPHLTPVLISGIHFFPFRHWTSLNPAVVSARNCGAQCRRSNIIEDPVCLDTPPVHGPGHDAPHVLRRVVADLAASSAQV